MLWTNSKYVGEKDVFLATERNYKYIDLNLLKKVSEIVFVSDENKYIYDNYYDKIKDIKLIGITGTNGKTTTCYLIYQMLNLIGIKTAYIGTIGFYIDDMVFKLDNTTPEISLLYNMLYYAKKRKCKVVVMEVSSHALKQDRIYGLLFDSVLVTNITRDHLDYHKTLKDYIKSKQKLIHLTRGKKICILNKKDKYYKKFRIKSNNNIIIGKDVKIALVLMNSSNTYVVVKDTVKRCFILPFIGLFNVYNFLYAYYSIKYLGYNLNSLKDKYYLLKEPPGRMEKVKYKSNNIFIDYAHTPDAVLNVLKTVSKVKNNGIITIIGCGGDRDKEKRPMMAKVACKYSSFVIFTNDNPRWEDEKEIMKDILKGACKNYEVIYDRYDAIRNGIKMLKDNMILMILGKGHEDYQIIKGKKLYFSDKDASYKAINELEEIN